MDQAAAHIYLLQKPHSEETFPFGPDVAVFKVHGKMFATLADAQGEGRMNLKCDPHEALMLREMFDAILPGYHMNKAHWNTLKLNDSIPQGEVCRMIDNSYSLVVQKLPKNLRTTLLALTGQVQPSNC